MWKLPRVSFGDNPTLHKPYLQEEGGTPGEVFVQECLLNAFSAHRASFYLKMEGEKLSPSHLNLSRGLKTRFLNPLNLLLADSR
jgi:hypothetical protein